MRKISIIIPVYNSEKTVIRCIDSCISQTLEDIEIIIVNDGSNDKSLQLCESYKDGRVKVLSIPNQGVSHARNLGLANCNSEYVMFVDADDYIQKGCCKRIYDFAHSNDLELLCFKQTKLNSQEEKEIGSKFIERLGEDAVQWMDTITVWGKLIKRDIIFKNNICFDETLAFGEDTLFIYEVMKSCSEFGWISDRLYCYCDDNNTSLSKVYVSNINVFIERLKELDSELKKIHPGYGNQKRSIYVSCALLKIYNLYKKGAPLSAKKRLQELYSFLSEEEYEELLKYREDSFGVDKWICFFVYHKQLILLDMYMSVKRFMWMVKSGLKGYLKINLEKSST